MRNRDKAPICSRDCFNCTFDDCICDEMTPADYEEVRALDDFARPKTKKQRARAAYWKAYYEENRESIAAKKKAYREENRESIAAYQKAYYEENRESIAAYQKAYYEENRESIAAKKKAFAFKACRKEHGYTQLDLAARMGVSSQLISHLETARIPLDLHFADLVHCMPDLPDYILQFNGGDSHA